MNQNRIVLLHPTNPKIFNSNQNNATFVHSVLKLNILIQNIAISIFFRANELSYFRFRCIHNNLVLNGSIFEIFNMTNFSLGNKLNSMRQHENMPMVSVPNQMQVHKHSNRTSQNMIEIQNWPAVRSEFFPFISLIS